MAAEDIVIVREGPFPLGVVVVIVIVERLTEEILVGISIASSQT